MRSVEGTTIWRSYRSGIVAAAVTSVPLPRVERPAHREVRIVSGASIRLVQRAS
jgi:hypothetical protein